MKIDFNDYPKTIPVLFIILGLFALKQFILYIYKKRTQAVKRDNFVIGISTIYYILLSILLVILVLLLLKVNIKEFFTSISIIAAALAIVSKDYISNAINGMILMFNNQIALNDYIRIGEHKGKIINISLLNVQLINDDDDLIYIANNTVLSNDIVNYTRGETHKTYIEFWIENHYLSTIDEIESYLYENAVSKNNLVIEDTFKIKIITVKSDLLKLKAEVKLSTKERKQERLYRRQIIDSYLNFVKLKQKNSQ